MSTPVANLVERFHAKRSGNGWLAHCPAHQDKTPSLSIAEGSDGRALLKCFAGCENTAILSALGMSFVDLFPVPAPAPVKSAATETPKAAVTPRPLGEILDALQSILRRYVVFQSQEQVAVIATWI